MVLVLKKYKEIIFDIDGTLLNSNLYSLNTLQKTLSIVENKEYEIEDLKVAMGLSDYDVFKLLNVSNIEMCYSTWKQLSKQYDCNKVIFDGIVSVLQELKSKHIKMGIVTSQEFEQYKNSIVYKQLHDYFDIVVTSDMTKKHKPYADPIICFLESINSDGEETIYIGDTKYDAICALNSGVDFALAAWGLHQDFVCKNILNKPYDILKLI